MLYYAKKKPVEDQKKCKNDIKNDISGLPARAVTLATMAFCTRLGAYQRAPSKLR